MASSIQNVDPSHYRELARLPKAFSYQELKKATNDFSEMLGEGGSGSVFKGRLEDGTPIAVKRINVSDNCKIFFEGEVSTIGRLHHKNLVHLQGFCSHGIETGGDSYIVYNLLQNGSLDTWIFSKKGRPSGKILSWKLRFRVAVDVAKALIYLHDFCSPQIIHCDIKPANVLLNDNFGGVLADFGLSVITKKDGSHTHSSSVRGTPGYMAPEMVWNNEKSSKSDMYSFGKVLLDMFFGQVYVCLDMDGNDIYKKDGNSLADVRTFHSFIREKLEKNEIVHLADKRLKEEVNEAEANTLVNVALCCVEEDPKLRPRNMQRVLQLLQQGQQIETEVFSTTMDPSPAVGPVMEIVKCAAVPAARHLSYMIRYKKNVDELKSMVDNDLVPLEMDLKAKVDSAQRGGEKVFEVMKEWLQKAETAKSKTSELNDGASQITSCFTGWFSQRYHLGKEASNKIVGVTDILKDGRDLLNQSIAMIPILQLAPYECSTIFVSQQSAKRRIIEALRINEVNMVGVYGMGGVGKTTLLKQIHQHAKEANLFVDVVMVTVSQNPRLEDIQTEIAEKLGMELKEKNVSARAG